MIDENEAKAVAWLEVVAPNQNRMILDPLHEAARVAIAHWAASHPDLGSRIDAAHTQLRSDPSNDESWVALIRDATVGAGLLCPARLPEDPELWGWLVPFTLGMAAHSIWLPRQ